MVRVGPDRSLYLRCNTEMVDLDTLDDEDVDWLRGIVTMHMEETGSPVAEHILVQVVAQRRFVHRDLPEGLKLVLELGQRDAIERGVDVDAAVMAAARG